MGVETKVQGRSLMWLNAACAVGLLTCSSSGQSALKKPLEPTFQLQEAKTPAESLDSIKLLERALELTQTALGPDDRAVGELAYRLAQRYDEAGDYDQALRFFERSLAIKEKELGPEDPGVADCLNDLGLLYRDLGNYQEALELLHRSLKITEKALGSEHPEVATTLSNLADTYADRGDYADALPLAQHALRIREKALGSEHPDVADSLSTLADVYRGLGNTDQALHISQKALRLAEKALSPTDALVATCLSTLADVQRDRRNLPEAARLYTRALAIDEKMMGPEHPEVFRALSSLAQTWILAGDLHQAVSTLGTLSGRQRSYLARHFQTSSWKVASQVADLFRESSEILQTLCAGTATSSTNSSIVEEAAQNSALNKGFWEEVQAAHAALEASQGTQVAELQAEHERLESQLTLLPETESDADKRDIKRLEMESQLSRIGKELARRVGVVAQRVLEEKTSLRDIARRLPQGAVLVDFAQYRRYDFSAKTNQWREQHYAAYLIFAFAPASTNLHVERIDLGEAFPIDQAVQVVCRRMSAGQYEAQDLSLAIGRLSELIYRPLSKPLANSSHLVICPDGQLSRLPFEMLLNGRTPKGESAEPERFLVEEKIVSYVGSGREVVRFHGDGPVGQGPQVGRAPAAESDGKSLPPAKCFVMGNPDFDLDPQNVQAADAAIPATTSPLPSLSRDYHGMKFNPLPGAEDEARAVARLLGDGTILKLGSDARKGELQAAVSPQVLLLATHGFFLSDQELRRSDSSLGAFLARGAARQRTVGKDSENPLMRCGIALAGANRAFTMTNSVAEDGLLTGLEASMLDLQGTKLVILSACDSGNGEVRIGEGVMSLQRAFRIAGAQTVLASHWEVSDKATDELVTRFIELWRSGKPRAQAWREAQLALAHSKDHASPYFWAAFTLTGQW